ncbi:rod shape-determining protein MreD [Adhaeribacter aerolatus]|uniref:Rod shape-determining protein MreD n=1 Tax=Adhaeribacter aerolatus TaxID=670289 RepID=A0A512B038_9BACT|nr:hypothetical protein [Adhaeribacter aerolatus]GEO05333.1 rod shape-determining protein MreD [Adhaeribacter aerolatus]
MSKRTFVHIFQFFIFMAVQILLVRNVVLFNTAFCYIYIAFLLFLPIQMPRVALLLMAFLTGLTVDIFYDTVGINAAACVLLAFLRPYVLLVLTPRDDYEKNDTINLHVMGWRWFTVYALFLVFIHHLALFFLELGSFREVGFTMAKVVLSTLLTYLVLIIIQLLFFSVRRSGR